MGAGQAETRCCRLSGAGRLGKRRKGQCGRRFENRGDGAFQAWLRQILLNRIRQEIRRASRRPQADELDSRIEDEQTTPLEAAVGREAVERYEQALGRLKPSDREVIIARVELGQNNDEIAQAFGKPSANAARMAVERALFRLAREMRRPE